MQEQQKCRDNRPITHCKLFYLIVCSNEPQCTNHFQFLPNPNISMLCSPQHDTCLPHCSPDFLSVFLCLSHPVSLSLCVSHSVSLLASFSLSISLCMICRLLCFYFAVNTAHINLYPSPLSQHTRHP